MSVTPEWRVWSNAVGQHGRAAWEQIGGLAWLDQNAVILAGVTVGAGAVVGANAVVVDDVPACTIALGAPARIVGELPGFSPA